MAWCSALGVIAESIANRTLTLPTDNNEWLERILFDKADDARRVSLMRTLDRLNLRFGRDAVTFAVCGRKRPWTMQRARLSPCYTTAWNDLLRV